MLSVRIYCGVNKADQSLSSKCLTCKQVTFKLTNGNASYPTNYVGFDLGRYSILDHRLQRHFFANWFVERFRHLSSALHYTS